MICHYYLTYECNCRCEYCNIWVDASLAETRLSSLGAIEKNLSSMKRLGVTRIDLTGGEPLLREDIVEIAAMVKNKGFEADLHTNGLLFPPLAEKLKGLIDRVLIYIDSPDENEHNRVKGQECFKEALDAVRAARVSGIPAVMEFTLTRDNIKHLPEMADLSKKEGCGLRISPVHHFYGLEGFEPISVEYILRYKKLPHVMIDQRIMDLLIKGGNDTSKPLCRALPGSISISPDDCLILPCFSSRQAYIPINGKLEQVLSSDIFAGYKKLQGKLGPCAGCLDPDCLGVPGMQKARRLLDVFRRKRPS